MKKMELSFLKTPWLLLDALYLCGYGLLLFGSYGSHVLLASLLVMATALLGLARLPLQRGEDLLLILLVLVLPFSVLSRAQILQQRGVSANQSEDAEPTWVVHGSWAKRVGLVAVLAVLLMACWSGFVGERLVNPVLQPVESSARDTLQRSMTLAAASYATARLIDRASALVSEVEFSVSLFGGAAFKPFQVLKPVQDMAVRYSDMMVLAMVSVGIQLMLLEMAESAVTLLGSAALLALILVQLTPRVWASLLVLMARFLLALLIIIKLAIPLSAMAVGQVSQAVLDSHRQTLQAEVDGDSKALNRIEQINDESSLSGWLRDINQKISDFAEAVKMMSDNMVERLVMLLVIYTLETLILPLVMLLLMWRAASLYVSPMLYEMRTRQTAPPAG